MRTILAQLALTIILLAPACCRAQDRKPSATSTYDSLGPSVQLCQLLEFEGVRADLGIASQDYKLLTDALYQVKTSGLSIKQFEKLSFDERFRVLDKQAADAQAIDNNVWGVLTELLPQNDIQALMGAHLNYYGPRSILNARIASELGLSDQQKNEITATIDQYRTNKRSILTDMASKKRTVTESELKLNETGLAAAIAKRLTDQQRQSLANMTTAGKRLYAGGERITLGW